MTRSNRLARWLNLDSRKSRLRSRLLLALHSLMAWTIMSISARISSSWLARRASSSCCCSLVVAEEMQPAEPRLACRSPRRDHIAHAKLYLLLRDDDDDDTEGTTREPGAPISGLRHTKQVAHVARLPRDKRPRRHKTRHLQPERSYCIAMMTTTTTSCKKQSRAIIRSSRLVELAIVSCLSVLSLVHVSRNHLSVSLCPLARLPANWLAAVTVQLERH